ncbi:MAG: transcription elongation factor GreA [Oscillospiraceae bacterium]|jgi:transcription elongation factor GreA|nr:transcription elongation factor GreA [Oscillospiraceae bacterium]
MAKETRIKMSAEHYRELQDKLQYLQTVREKEVAQQLKEARSFGDLSENSEYDEAKNEQGKLHSQIAEIKNQIENAEIIKETERTGTVNIGSRVTVHDIEFNTDDLYQIVGSQEADPVQSKISDDSPFGKSLLGHVVGDVVEVDAPSGIIKFEILKVD